MPSRQVLLSTTAVVKAKPLHGKLTAVFLAQTINVSEDRNLIEVDGIGDFFPRDLAAVGWAGMIGLDFHASSYIIHPTGGVRRQFKSKRAFQAWHTYFAESVEIELYDNQIADLTEGADRDAIDLIVATPIPKYVLKIKDALWTNDTFSSTNKAISSRSTNFRYLSPIIDEGKEDFRNITPTE